jgi:outer membrane protein assembly factor BamB
MEKQKLKPKISMITLILLLATSALLVAFPTATAQEVEYSKTTHAYIGAIPNPVGVNQQVLIHAGITDFLRLYHHGWEGLTVTVTKPDGQTETLGPLRTDSTGGTGAVFIPSMVGTYKLQTHFPEQTYDWEGGISRVTFTGLVNYEASDSEILELVVQAEPLEYYQAHSLPTEYWSRPIDAQLREWSPIAGNWVQTPEGYFAPYNDGPETPHILWAKDLERGGLAGGMYGEHAYQCGDAYEGKFASSVIIAGVLYYNRFTLESRGGPAAQGIVAVDLHTGEELWFRNNTVLSFGQVYYWDSFNYHATFGYLWETVGRTWNAYDIQTGEWIFSLEDVPSGSTVRGPNGGIYRYNVDEEDGWMTLWNLSRVIQPFNTGGSGDGSWQRQVGRDSDHIFDATTGIEWNVTIPAGLKGSANDYAFEDRIIGTLVPGTTSNGREDMPMEMWCISVKPGQEGTLLWQKSWQPPPGDITLSVRDTSFEDGVFVVWAKETRTLYGFSTNTGDLVWGPTASQDYLDIFGSRSLYAYGKFFLVGMSGIVHAYDIKTGTLLWTYRAPDELSEVLWTNQWHIRPVFITDNMMYLGTSEHSPVDPKPRGSPFVCIDLENGDEVFRADGLFRQNDWGGRAIIGDSIIATMDSYDQRIYAIGKGPSATTIEPIIAGVPSGSSVTLVGRVTDVSPGTMDVALKTRFPNGVPAVADENMNEWMLYVYKQFERPNVNGVQIKIEIVDPNGQYAWIGTATSDAYGNYAYSWKPTIEGQYMIMATFDGTKSYYGSNAITYLTVDPAASPSGPITPETPEAPLISTEAAIIGSISIATVLGLASFSIIRKRK